MRTLSLSFGVSLPTAHHRESQLMSKRPIWFIVLAAVALLWNLAGLAAVVGDLQLSATDIEALPPSQQAFYHARPVWSVFASLLAVVGGVLGCVGLLLRKRWALIVLYASLLGIVVQDAGLILVSRVAGPMETVPIVLQSSVFVLGIGLVLLARLALRRTWLT
ncbi:MAG: hypothetical protein ABIU96_07825 [Rhodanobacter sp.]